MFDREKVIALLGVAEIDAQAAVARALGREVQGRVRRITRVREQDVEAALLALPEEAFLADEDLMKFLFRESAFNGALSDLETKILATGARGVQVDGYDLRDPEWERDRLPALRLWLRYDQDVTEVAEAIRAWAAKFAFGRPSLQIAVLEHSCGEDGSWAVTYDIATDHAVVLYGWPYSTPVQERYAGPLVGALECISVHAWGHGGPESSSR